MKKNEEKREEILLIKDSESNNPEVMSNKQIEEMAHLVCGMANRPNSCQECAGRKGGCFTLPKMKILHDHGYHKQSELTPCDCCQFSPPSSTDGKPCSVCPAQAKMKGR